MRGRKLITTLGLSLLLILGGLATGANAAESPEDFYRGKIIKIVVSSRPGGGTDLSARIIAPYIQKYTGASRVVIRNKGEAGGLVAVNYVYNRVKPDGLTLGLDPVSIPFQSYLTDYVGVKFELTKIPFVAQFLLQQWLGFLGTKGPYSSIEDLKSAKGLKFGGAAPGGGITIGSALILYFFDLDGKVVTGFRGTTGVAMALARGEIHGSAAETPAVLRNMKQGYVKPIMTLDYKRARAFPEVPAVTELMKFTGEKNEILDSFLMTPGAKTICVPPGTPKDKLQFLREAVAKIRQDEGFQKQIKKAMGTECEWVSVEDTENLVRRAVEAKEKGTFKKLTDIVAKYRG
jgi:tripartite-type tricarboxylate transporter receptor subunit TctC